MGQFRYVDNNLLCEDTPLIELAEEFGTPLYVYSKNQILENYRLFNAATSYDQRITICYAVKANSNPAILKMLAEEGAGADVVSAGELSLTLQAGFPAEKISFSGVGKTEEELEYAIKHNIACINAESIQELQLISRIGLRLNKYVRVTLRFNPDVDAESHPNITTGLSINKFGLEGLKALEYFDIASKLPNIVPIGIHTHIGSQITKTEPFIKTAQFIVDTIKKLREAGFTITHIDFGGGFGVRYINALTHEALPKEPNGAEVPSAKGFTDSFLPQLLETGCSIWLEPGRIIVAESGVLLTKVLYTKETSSKKFVIVDAAMTELIRPALYKAYHQVVPLKIETYEHETVDVVGPVCETSDFIALNRMMPKLKQGNYLAIMTAGAYGFVSSSNYNMRPKPAEVLVNADKVRIIREREDLHLI